MTTAQPRNDAQDKPPAHSSAHSDTQPQNPEIWQQKKPEAAAWFKGLRERICSAFEQIERDYSGEKHADIAAGTFERTPWSRPESNTPNESGSILNGGGEISLMRGRVFEKVGVNISTVHGVFSPEFREKIPGANESDGNFWASGISLVAHMRSPLVPAVHMNTRMIVTSKGWFGGGADLNPMYEDIKDTQAFHDAFKTCCDRHDPAYYPKFKKWCDEYFFIKHRNIARGVGGIFYDYIDNNDWQRDFDFTKDVGETFLAIYPELVRQSMHKDWNAEQREHQLIKRGYYAEYNLVYDRGTQFGLKTGGNTEAILMSLPPEAKWP
ncbi:MAG: oxygen-dependent coproporphyrinogen oxidase [Alphaproteobacteria bacterium]